MDKVCSLRCHMSMVPPNLITWTTEPSKGHPKRCKPQADFRSFLSSNSAQISVHHTSRKISGVAGGGGQVSIGSNGSAHCTQETHLLGKGRSGGGECGPEIRRGGGSRQLVSQWGEWQACRRRDWLRVIVKTGKGLQETDWVLPKTKSPCNAETF